MARQKPIMRLDRKEISRLAHEQEELESRRRQKLPTNKTQFALAEMRKGRWKKALNILKEQLEKGVLDAYTYAIFCYTKLKEIGPAERLIELGLRRGISEYILKTKILELYFETKQYQKFLETYNRIIEIGRNVSLNIHINYLKYLGLFGETTKARLLYEQLIKMATGLKKQDLNVAYIEYGLLNSPEEAIKFAKELKKKTELTCVETKALFTNLFRLEKYDEITKFNFNLLNHERNTQTNLIVLHAQIRKGKYKEVSRVLTEKEIKTIDESNLHDDCKTYARFIYSCALNGIGSITEARQNFEMLLLNTDKFDKHYPDIFCAYILTNPLLKPAERTKFRTYLTEQLDSTIDL